MHTPTLSTPVLHTQVLDEKETAVYKRALEEQYKLKMKASRCVGRPLNWLLQLLCQSRTKLDVLQPTSRLTYTPIVLYVFQHDS
jgi:hypothetical protein